MIAEYIKGQILEGRVVLFLGAGASIPCKSKDGLVHGLSGNQLKEVICDKFLLGEGKQKSLSYISSVCINRYGQREVHKYVKTLVDDLEPSAGHLLIPQFTWKAIITTNYDELVEKAYQQYSQPLQKIEKIISDNDDYQEAISNNKLVPFLKIHGCITRLNDSGLPLILSDENYHSYLKNRNSLFQSLRELATNHTIIFCGYSLADANVKGLIFDLTNQAIARPKFVLLDPYLDEMDYSYWSAQNFDCFKLDLNDFLNQMLITTTSTQRTLGGALSGNKSVISKLIPSHNQPTLALENYLLTQLTYINKDINEVPVSPSQFYKGNSTGLGWLVENYDFERTINITLLDDIFFNDAKNILDKTYFNILTGYAGSGKTIALKRLAWDAAITYDFPVFCLNEGSVLKVEEIYELSKLIQDRIFIFIDSCHENQAELANLLAYATREKLKLTIISSARINEWNDENSLFDKYDPNIYTIRDLNFTEIDYLIDKLVKFNLLGILKYKSNEERVDYLKVHLARQLLVTLHEITEGKTFEEILYDEYERISNRLAKNLYLDICTLHKLNINVRAGLVSRLSGINFEEFKKNFMMPLESVILSHQDYKIGDFVYRTRHPIIADIVYNFVFSSPIEKSQQLIKILRYLNISYECDRIAMEAILRGKHLAEDFTNKDLVYGIYTIAEEIGISKSFILHQKAVFEFRHINGDLLQALKFISEIEHELDVNYNTRSVQHTKANILRKLASNSSSAKVKKSYREQSLTILNKSTRNSIDPLPFITKGYLLIDELNDFNKLTEEETFDRLFADILRDFEVNLSEGYRKFPNHPELLMLESKYSSSIKNSPRALKALEAAYRANKDNLYTVIRYTRNTLDRKLFPEAKKIINEYLRNHPNSKEANYELANIYIHENEKTNSEIISKLLRKSFSTGDTNFNSRFRYARHEFLYGDTSKAKIEFNELMNSAASSYIKNLVRAPIVDTEDRPLIYKGKIISLHDSYGFIKSDSFEDNIFVNYTVMDDEEAWNKLSINDSIYFSVAFTFRGARANKISLNNDDLN